jgi:hypothetical protein
MKVPQSEGKALSLLDAKARVLSRTYGEAEMVELDVEAPESIVRRLRQYVVKERRKPRAR